MGAEDFSYFLEQRPASFARLGAAAAADTVRAGVHTPKLNVDEGAIAVGIAYYLSLVQAYLQG